MPDQPLRHGHIPGKEEALQYISHYDSPLGGMLMAADDEGLTGLWFDGQKYYARGLCESAWEYIEAPDIANSRNECDHTGDTLIPAPFASTASPAGGTPAIRAAAPAGEIPASSGVIVAPAGEIPASPGAIAAPAGEIPASSGAIVASAGEIPAPFASTASPAGGTPAIRAAAPAGELPAASGVIVTPAISAITAVMAGGIPSVRAAAIPAPEIPSADGAVCGIPVPDSTPRKYAPPQNAAVQIMPPGDLNSYTPSAGSAFPHAAASHIAAAKRWLSIYFAGNEPDFAVPLHLRGTSFQKEVWRLLLGIPYGHTVTYGELAARIAIKRDIPRMSSRAVGGAVGRNNIAIIIPCHRVIGAGNSLTGYAAGLNRKLSLLRLENAGFRQR